MTACAITQPRLGIGFGETTADSRFTLLPIVCLGACEQAPAMMIDDDLHGSRSGQDWTVFCEEYR